MLDTVHVRFPCKHRSFGTLQFLDENQLLQGECSRRRLVHGAFDATRCSVKSCSNRTELYFQGSPAKFLQGHNIVGSNNLVGLLCVLFDRITTVLGIQVAPEDRRKWSCGDFHLTRVDWAISFDLGDSQTVSSALATIERCVRASGVPYAVYGTKGITETVMIRPHSKWHTVALYDKSRELAQSRKALWRLPQGEKLIAFSRGLLRVELRLHATYLRSRSNDSGMPLCIGSSWSPPFARRLVLEHVHRLQLGNIQGSSLPREVLEMLSGRLKRIYLPWLRGDDLSNYCSRSTLARAKKDLLALGIDISVPRPTLFPSEGAGSLLDDGHVATVPNWLRDSPCFVRP